MRTDEEEFSLGKAINFMTLRKIASIISFTILNFDDSTADNAKLNKFSFEIFPNSFDTKKMKKTENFSI
jgi:hypothetical protein